LGAVKNDLFSVKLKVNGNFQIFWYMGWKGYSLQKWNIVPEALVNTERSRVFKIKMLYYT